MTAKQMDAVDRFCDAYKIMPADLMTAYENESKRTRILIFQESAGNDKAIMQAIQVTDTYDTAKPQKWMDEMRDRHGFDYWDLYYNYVWLYDAKAKLDGRPFNYMAAYARFLISNK